MDNTTPTSEQVRSRILEAAGQRFRHYGYNKTTMAEIANDCGMSAANLYRHFENKLDIGAELASRCMREEETMLRQIVARRGTGAARRLESLILELLHQTHEVSENQPRIRELVEAVCTQRLDVIEHNTEIKHALLVKLLEDGNARGEFAVDDADTIAEAILDAIIKFDVPSFMHFHPLPEFERRARNVAQLLLRGLVKR